MRRDTERKQHTRRRVLKVAARAIRAEGPHRIAVARVMRGAGLTHGGFYAHFTSKADLVAQAIDVMFDEAIANMSAEAAGRPPRAALLAIVDRYLSIAQRDATETGCPIPKLASDVPRLPSAARRAFARGVERFEALIAAPLRALNLADADGVASIVLAEMVGALTLARASGGIRSKRLLATARAHIVTRFELAGAS
ncbi:MAG: TetR/AcrR family transcriptional regulator [Candidatus Eremiobacteraeota bacterium]|nr:TetR/AcrR family transcriptional regulator [Candidatus Eremiobacteraeota bacterium]